MAINRDYLMKKGLSPFDFFLMMLIFQNSSEDMHEDIALYMEKDNLTRMHALGLLKLVQKKRKKDHEYTTLRLSKKGKDIYKNAQILDFTEQDEILFNAIKGLYFKLDKPIGNDEQVKRLLAWFRAETQYTRKMIFIAARAFLMSMEESNSTKYIPSLENLLWKGQSVFSQKWNLANSKLYQFIQENKQKLNANRTSKPKG